MDGFHGAVQPMHMPKKAKPEAAPKHFIKKWRKHLRRKFGGYSLEEVAADVGTTHATLSRVENGKLDYTQWLLEALAWRYKVTPADLLSRDPDEAPAERRRA